MTAIITGSIAILFYLSGAILQYFALKRRDNSNRSWVLILGGCALALHTLSFNNTFYTPQGLDFGFYNVASLIGWLMAILITSSGLRKPLLNLFIGVYPIAALALLCALLNASIQHPSHPVHSWSPQISSHILLSMLAYSVLTIAALQALLLALQDHHLRNHHTNGLIMQLPALQIMEKLLFELVWIGIVLLSISIVTGILFIEDMFAQHLAHKTILSIIAWGIFSTLLLGRYKLGWRGTTAIRWALGGYLLLMLAFFGSKLVLEIILGQF